MLKAFLLTAVVAFGVGLGVGALMQSTIPEVYRAAELHRVSGKAQAQAELIADYEAETRAAYHASTGQTVCPVR